jgi:hypothetical protein
MPACNYCLTTEPSSSRGDLHYCSARVCDTAFCVCDTAFWHPELTKCLSQHTTDSDVAFTGCIICAGVDDDVMTLQALSQHVQQQLADNAPAAAQAPAGQEWVRGWEDAWRWVHEG